MPNGESSTTLLRAPLTRETAEAAIAVICESLGIRLEEIVVGEGDSQVDALARYLAAREERENIDLSLPHAEDFRRIATLAYKLGINLNTLARVPGEHYLTTVIRAFIDQYLAAHDAAENQHRTESEKLVLERRHHRLMLAGVIVLTAAVGAAGVYGWHRYTEATHAAAEQQRVARAEARQAHQLRVEDALAIATQPLDAVRSYLAGNSFVLAYQDGSGKLQRMCEGVLTQRGGREMVGTNRHCIESYAVGMRGYLVQVRRGVENVFQITPDLDPVRVVTFDPAQAWRDTDNDVAFIDWAAVTNRGRTVPERRRDGAGKRLFTGFPIMSVTDRYTGGSPLERGDEVRALEIGETSDGGWRGTERAYTVKVGTPEWWYHNGTQLPANSGAGLVSVDIADAKLGNITPMSELPVQISLAGLRGTGKRDSRGHVSGLDGGDTVGPAVLARAADAAVAYFAGLNAKPAQYCLGDRRDCATTK